ncbi:hypothetical protein QJS04_geneDACA000254 [Acorus gramineus]|uniref:Late embryogenesis abundant protein LEA-2 subgroup domain-containing protein n=1 Tax=Acorus gramineus TaxID=55184 RepID=A0AAV9ARC7_ACOGR|nr:hypothetical protein QJS04_geneDACA000254 [Acorus gramineus]
MQRPQPSRRPPTRPPQYRRPPTLLRCVVFTILAIIILVGLAVLVTWLVIRPTKIEYAVENATITHYNLTSKDALNATFDVSLVAYNPNRRVSIYYEQVEFSVWYADQMVVSRGGEAFYQPRRNVTRLDFEAAAEGVRLMKGDVAVQMRRERSGGRIYIEVKMKARVRFRVGSWRSKHYTMRVDCYPVTVRFGKKKAFERTDCEVDL